MVNSILDSSLKYIDVKKIQEEDMAYNAPLYEIELYPGFDAHIVLGNVSYTYINKNILYLPVYLIKDKYVVLQIGVYEVRADKYAEYLDDDGDLNIEKLSNPFPLYYSFFNEKLLRSILNTDIIKSKSETVENKEIEERTIYKEEKGDPWIKRYMKSANYSIIDNEAGGDCLFAVIRDSFKGKKDLSVDMLRELISSKATEDVYNTFKEHYNMYVGEINNLKKQQILIKKNVDEIKKSFNDTKVKFQAEDDRKKKSELATNANKFAAEIKELTRKFNNLKEDIAGTRELFEEFKWMKGVTSLELLKEKLKTKEFWANSWTINVLEKELNVKLIILSSSNYESGDVDNVLQCGDFTDEEIMKGGEFKPDHYIITSYRGDHYMLITYNNKRIFTFDELPNSIKDTVITKCMENNKGIYNYIPNFNKMKQERKSMMSADSNEGETKHDEIAEDSAVEFDEDVVLQFYSKSNGSKRPGKGSGEKIPLGKEKNYNDLHRLKDWRRVLSNFYVTQQPIEIDGMKYKTVEHYYHSQKFKNENEDFSKQFSLDSGSDMSKDAQMAKSAGGKTGRYKGVKIRDDNVKLDEGFFTSGENKRAMYRGQLAKYKQDELARKVLLATNNAKLQHFVRGGEPVVFYDTMKIRQYLLQRE